MVVALWLLVLVTFVWSAIAPHDRFTWWLEVFPAIGAAILLVATRRRLTLSRLLYGLIAVHAIILIIGGKYTYAEVPLGFWMQEWFGFARNHYDRIGHFAQGFIPAIAAREILLRVAGLRRDRWLPFLVCSIALAVSALYELLEWAVAALTGESVEAFLGTQGDVWDTQKDMLLALIGAATALLLLSRWHDRSIARQNGGVI